MERPRGVRFLVQVAVQDHCLSAAVPVVTRKGAGVAATQGAVALNLVPRAERQAMAGLTPRSEQGAVGCAAAKADPDIFGPPFLEKLLCHARRDGVSLESQAVWVRV